MKYSIVVTTYNRPDLTKLCIQRAITTAGKEFELVWVDDASPDPKVREVMKKFVPSKTILRKENGGWAKAVNDGLREATGDYIFQLDNDNLLPEKWLRIIDGFIEKIPETGGIAMMWDGFSKHGWAGKKKKINGITVQIANKFMCFRGFSRRVFERVGYLDDRLGWYGPQDTDWSNRALKTGELFYYVPGVKVLHCEDNLNRDRKLEWIKDNPKRLKDKKDKSIYYSPWKNSR